jgi:hypothetical protein
MDNKLSREEIILHFKPLLKGEGFRKTRSTWHKSTEDLIFVFNVQGSLYSEEYYINVAIYIKALGDETNPPEYRCHLKSRIDATKPYLEIFQDAIKWFEVHNSIEKLTDLNYKKILPPTTAINATEYLSSLEK